VLQCLSRRVCVEVCGACIARVCLSAACIIHVCASLCMCRRVCVRACVCVRVRRHSRRWSMPRPCMGRPATSEHTTTEMAPRMAWGERRAGTQPHTHTHEERERERERRRLEPRDTRALTTITRECPPRFTPLFTPTQTHTHTRATHHAPWPPRPSCRSPQPVWCRRARMQAFGRRTHNCVSERAGSERWV
jgi:hypothetical protein